MGGSDDPALDLLLRLVGDAVSVVPGPRGSVNGIVSLARGAADAATVHLLDVTSGRWNDPIARGALGGAPVELVHLWRREQGLVVADGNPHGIAGVADLDARRIAWRAARHGLAPVAGAVDAGRGVLLRIRSWASRSSHTSRSLPPWRPARRMPGWRCVRLPSRPASVGCR